MPDRHHRAAKSYGFTLVELLLLLGALALLIGLLVPALSAARRTARQAQCASNLRQWGAAMQLYAASNDGYLPRRGQGVDTVHQITRDTDWFNALPPLMGNQSYRAMAAAGQMPHDGVWACAEATDSFSAYFFDYAMNMWLSTWKGNEPDRLERLGNPATLVFMADGPAGHCSTLPANAPYSPVPRHKNNVNVCFLDGHVGAFAADYIGCGLGDPHRPDVRWVVPNSPWPGPN